MSAACPVCGSRDAASSVRKQTREGPLTVWRCRECGHGYLRSRPTHFEADRYEYYRRFLGQSPRSRQTPLNERRYRELLDDWGPRVRGRRLLDVGCGDGHLVRVAGERGWDARGIDLAEGAIELARSWGISCETIDFFDPALDRERYDVIYMSELIEHVPEPSRFVARIAELLAPGGLAYLTTPNYSSITRRALGADWSAIHFEHLSYFTPGSFRRLARAAPQLELDIATKNVSIPSIVQSLARRRRASGEAVKVGGDLGPSTAAEQSLRARVYASRTLLGAMNVANRALTVLGAGDSLIATLRRGA